MASDKSDELAAWPVYALADYTDSGRLLDQCRSLLSLGSLFQPADQTRRNGMPPPPPPPVRREEHSDYCATTSGYQTLEERPATSSSIRQNSSATERKARPPRALRSATFSTTSASGQPASWPNKSQLGRAQACRRQDQERQRQRRPTGERLLWWHLIEPVNYGKLAQRDDGQATPGQESDVMDLQLDSLYRARVAQLCHEIARAVRLVSSIA